jgi:hypothetical protein
MCSEHPIQDQADPFRGISFAPDMSAEYIPNLRGRCVEWVMDAQPSYESVTVFYGHHPITAERPLSQGHGHALPYDNFRRRRTFMKMPGHLGVPRHCQEVVKIVFAYSS